MPILRSLLVCLCLWMPQPGQADLYLLMAEEDGCVWCARWNADLAEIYPKTPEGRAAPLERYDIRDDPPRPVEFESRVRFTPTFILVRDGVEIGRIEGYPGENLFWALLGLLLERNAIELDEVN